jgi:putative ATP-binding cassette transporter
MSVVADGSRLLSFLVRWSRGQKGVRLTLVAVVLLGAVSGFTSTGLLALVNSMLNRPAAGMGSRLGLAFVALCLLMPVSRFVSGVLLTRLIVNAVTDLRMRLCRDILSAPLRRFEEHGAHRALNVLTEDIPAITNALSSFPSLCMQLFIVIGALIYLGSLSIKVLLLTLGFMVVGILSYQLPLTLGLKFFRDMRIASDALMKHFRAVTDGGKELRLHRPRRRAFLDQELQPTLIAVQESGFSASALLLGAVSWGQTLFFMLVGCLLFLMPRFGVESGPVLTGYTLVVLYMMTPLESILNMLPGLSHAIVSIEASERLGVALSQGDAERPAAAAPYRAFERLELTAVTHSYRVEGEGRNFVVGPIDLTFKAGEMVFLTGGNGSGKTTLAKLLVGLYTPESGEIRLDGAAVTAEGFEEYRQLFSAVFTDFFLWERLLGLESEGLDGRAAHELARLRLDHKLEVHGGELSTLDLSQGQRKRLALMTACLEDRPVYLFDEWAADQDPLFKEIFYHQILPALKAEGKTVLVVTHDDRYYGVADRLIKLEYGQVELDTAAPRAAPAPAAG